jgi:hypothetical protein
MGDTDTTAGLHLFASGPDGVHDVNPSTGVLGPVLASNRNMLAVGPQRYFTSCGGGGGSSVCSYSLSTHALQWQRSIDDDNSLINIAAVAHGILVLGNGHILNANTGAIITELWNTDFNMPTSSLAIGDGRVAIATDYRVLDLYGLPSS